MEVYASIGTATNAPVLPAKLPDAVPGLGWGALFASPFALTLLGKWWEERQKRTNVDVKREESQVDAIAKMMTAFAESKDRLLEQVQSQQKTLLDDVINRHDEALQNMQASIAMQSQVSVTMAENLKTYAEMAIKRSEETARLLTAIEAQTNRTVIESFNSHIRINQEVARSLEKLKLANEQEMKMLEQLHFRFDKHYGVNLDSYDLRQQQS
jgi:hypothetical protein